MTYSYTISTDFPGGAANASKLQAEIELSGIATALDYVNGPINTNGDTIDIVFAASLSAGDKTTLDGDATGPAGGLIAAHDNSPNAADAAPVTISNADFSTKKHMKVQVQPREGTGTNFYTPNLCDQTTWYEGSTAVADFALTDSGDLTTWNTNGTHPGPWLDLTHGKVFQEDVLTAATPAYLCKVEVSTDGGTTWVEKTENSIDGADGDYSVNYAAGTVTFNSALNGGDQVRASFSKAAATFLLTIQPEAGKRIRIVHVETQLSVDVGITDDVVYEVWAYDPNDLPNKMLVKKSTYKTINDFLYESTGVYPKFPAIDASGPRGLAQDVIVVPFNYTASRDIVDSQGVEIRMKLNTPFTGLLCTSTFYCLSEDE